jgi:hypothetical protein
MVYACYCHVVSSTLDTILADGDSARLGLSNRSSYLVTSNIVEDMTVINDRNNYFRHVTTAKQMWLACYMWRLEGEEAIAHKWFGT